MASQNLGSVVHRLRTAGGLSQKDLADALEVDPTYISHLEANRREPSIKLLRRLASELDVPSGLLLALIIWTDLPPEERSTYQNLISRLVDTALVAQLNLPIAGDDNEEPALA